MKNVLLIGIPVIGVIAGLILLILRKKNEA